MSCEAREPTPQDWPFEKKCPVCGKTFCMTVTETWTYQLRKRDKTWFFCSWTCFGRFSEGTDGRKPWERLDKDRQRVIMDMAAGGADAKMISEMTGVSVQLAKYYVNKRKKGGAASG